MASGKTTGRGELQLSANALTVLERRYLVKNEAGQPAESPDEVT